MAVPQELLDKYRSFLIGTKGRSENTVRVYLDDLSTFNRFLEMENADFAQLDRRFLRRYLAWLATRARGKRGGYARVSVARKLVSLRAFYRFLRQEGIVKTNPVPKGSAFRVKTEKRLPDFLTENETERILQAPDTDTDLGLRDQAILELLYSSGIRLSELAALNMDDVDLETRQAKVFGKGSKERIVLLGGPAVQSLHLYMTASRPQLSTSAHPGAPTSSAHPEPVEGSSAPPSSAHPEPVEGSSAPTSSAHPEPVEGSSAPPSSALFLNKYGGRLSPRSIQKIVKKSARQSAINPKTHTHSMRHTFATHMLEGGADLRVVQELLGHSSPATTQIYTHVTQRQARKVYMASHPRANGNPDSVDEE